MSMQMQIQNTPLMNCKEKSGVTNVIKRKAKEKLIFQPILLLIICFFFAIFIQFGYFASVFSTNIKR